MNEYLPYSESDLRILMNKPGDIANDSYMLFAAYALSCLYDTCDDSDEDEPYSKNDMWGTSIPKDILDRVVMDVVEDFDDAATSRKPLRIWDRSYSIRRRQSYDVTRLLNIFKFPLIDGQYRIERDGVMNLNEASQGTSVCYDTSKEHLKANRTYLRQVIKLAEDDAHNGWDKLTDMEILIYCWALFHNKTGSDNWMLFMQRNKEYNYVGSEEIIKSCWADKARKHNRPDGLYLFDAQKVAEWNKANKQPSRASIIPATEADDYWYETAIKKNFKPRS